MFMTNTLLMVNIPLEHFFI